MNRTMKIVLVAGFASALAACTHMSDAPVAEMAQSDTSPALKAEQTEAFGMLAEFPGTRWLGEPEADSSEESSDIQEWSWALDGSAILIRHRLTTGSYGGDTYVYPRAKSDVLDYVYITNAGFITQGEFTLTEDGGWSAEEEVKGHPEISKVRSTGKMMPDGSLRSTSYYLKANTWEPGNSFVYRRTDLPLPTLNAEKALAASK